MTMLSPIQTGLMNFVCTTVDYVKKGILYNTTTRRISILAVGSAAIFTGNKIYHSSKSAELCSTILNYTKSTIFPCLKERVFPFFYEKFKITKLTSGLIALIATLIAVTVYIRLKNMQRELRQAQGQNTQLNVQNGQLKQQVEAQPIALQVQKNACETVHAELQQQINDQQDQRALLQQNLEIQTIQQAEMQQRLTTAQQDLTVLQQEREEERIVHEELIQELQGEKANLVQEREASARARAELERQLRNNEQGFARLIDKHAKESTDLRQQIEQLKCEKQKIQETNGLLRYQVVQLTHLANPQLSRLMNQNPALLFTPRINSPASTKSPRESSLLLTDLPRSPISPMMSPPRRFSPMMSPPKRFSPMQSPATPSTTSKALPFHSPLSKKKTPPKVEWFKQAENRVRSHIVEEGLKKYLPFLQRPLRKPQASTD